jgi:hypothetical protein
MDLSLSQSLSLSPQCWGSQPALRKNFATERHPQPCPLCPLSLNITSVFICQQLALLTSEPAAADTEAADGLVASHDCRRLSPCDNTLTLHQSPWSASLTTS